MPMDIFDLQAELCQTMSNATRIRIVHALRDGPLCVAGLADTLELPQAKVSQHLAVLRAGGILFARRQGNQVTYRITNPKIEKICDLMREVLAEQATKRVELIQAIQD